EAGIVLTLDLANGSQALVDISDDLAERELAGEMASYGKNVTGVDNTIFISEKGYARHAARIKVAIDPPKTFNSTGVTTSIAIDSGEVVAGKVPKAKLLNQVRQFIDINRNVLLDYWNSRFGTDELQRRLRSIEGQRPD